MSLYSITPKMIGANRILEKCMIFLTPLGVILGLILGHRISWMKPAVSYLFGFLTFSSALSISLNDFFNTMKRPKFMVVYWLGGLLIMPILSVGIAYLFFAGNSGIISGYALLRAIPTAVVGTVWASVFSGNMGIALSILIVDTVIAPVITPFLLKLLIGSSIQIDSWGMMTSLLFMVVIPSVAGMVINQLSRGRVTENVAPCLRPISKIFLLFVIMINTSQVAERLIANASRSYIYMAIASLLVAASGYVIGNIFTRIFHFNRDDSVSITYATAMRNVSAALVLAIDYLPPDGALPVIFGIIFQQSASAIAGNILFKKRPED